MLFPRTDVLAFDNILLHVGFAERENAKRTGAYLPFLQKVIKFAWRNKSASGFCF